MLIMLGVAAFCLTVSNDLVLNAMVVLGQAHFTMAYVYQYRAGKVDRAYMLKYVFFFSLLFGSFAIFDWWRTLGFVAAGYFVLHFLYDERFLLAEKPGFDGWVRLLPILVIFGAKCLYDWYEIDVLNYAGALAVSGATVWAARLVQTRRWPSYQDVSFALVFVLGLVFVYGDAVFNTPFQRNTMQFIVLTHYMNWYFHFLVRFKDKPVLYKTLIRDIIAFNGIIALAFLGYANLDWDVANLGRYAFEPSYFYLWTLMHYIVTFRPADLRNWVPTRATGDAS
jgi:hypothetical protein